MNEEPLEPLPPGLSGLVSAERRRPDPSSEAQARLLGKLAAAAVVPGGAPAGSAPAKAAAAGGGAAAVTAAKAVLVFGLGLGVGFAVNQAVRPYEAPRVVFVNVPVAAPAPQQPMPPPAADLEPAPVPAPPALAPRLKPGATKDLDAERRLLEAARAALQRGNAEAALAHIRQHELKHPAGDFVEEREAMAVQALGASGQHDAAATRAAAFRTRVPGSLLRPVVDAVSPP